MGDEARTTVGFAELMHLKCAVEWLTGYYEGASQGRALPAFVHERITDLDGWINSLAPYCTQSTDQTGERKDG